MAPGFHRDLPETAGSGRWLMPSSGRVSKLQCTGLVRRKKAADLMGQIFGNCLAGRLATHLLTDPMSGGSTSIGM